MIKHAMMQWSWYLKLEPNFCVMRTAWKDSKRTYKSNTNLYIQLKLQHMINFEYRLMKVLKVFKKTNANNKRSI